MPIAKPVARLSAAETLNFLLTNRVPRRWLTRLAGWYSRIENPVLARLSIAVWQLFVDDLRLDEAERRDFRSLHDCFTRRLRPGARRIDPNPAVLCSPCDAVVGQFGCVDGLNVLQAKGYPYTIDELFGDRAAALRYRDGTFATLRLKSSMYHRFHAPCDATLRRVDYLAGDTWNVNPVALKTVERLFCRNERAVLTLEPRGGDGAIALVAVAAILVASIRLHGITDTLGLDYSGPERIPCELDFGKGEEIGYFAHGSTIVLFATGTFQFVDGLVTGQTIRMGEPLLHGIDRAPALRENRA